MKAIGEQITLERLSKNPYPLFSELLANAPVCRVPAFDLWMVSRRKDVIDILRDSETFTMEPAKPRANPMKNTFGPMMLSLDGPRHKAVRDIFSEPFRARKVRLNYQMLIEQIAQNLVEEIQVEEFVDLDKAFSDRLAIYTVVAALGLDIDGVGNFRRWYDDFAAAIGDLDNDPNVRRAGRTAMTKFKTAVLTQIEILHQKPNQSVLSHILYNHRADLSTAEIVSNMALTFFGGVETTSAMLSNTIWALLNHPDALADVKRNPARLPAAIHEALRWESPVQNAMRFPTRDVFLHDITIPAGEKIYCLLGAANRDPAYFDDPNTYNFYRPNVDKHLAFAYGPHYCFGAPLALLEGEIGLGVLFERLPKLRLHPDYPTAPTGHEFRATPTLFALLY